MNKKRMVLLFGGLLLVVALIVIMCLYIHGVNDPENQVRKALETSPEVSKNQNPESSSEGDEVSETQAAPYKSPVDFQALWDMNQDVCAWLEIPGTRISYPVVKNQEDWSFYLDHNAKGAPEAAGALFMDDYNDKSMDEPVVAIYGHYTPNGEFFGNLQKLYESAEDFKKYQTIHLYLPDEMRTYRVCAAVPYNRVHILDAYDFNLDIEYSIFFDRIFSVRSLSAQFDENLYPEPGDHVLILSTCLRGDNTNRYLVIAREEL